MKYTKKYQIQFFFNFKNVNARYHLFIIIYYRSQSHQRIYKPKLINIYHRDTIL